MRSLAAHGAWIHGRPLGRCAYRAVFGSGRRAARRIATLRTGTRLFLQERTRKNLWPVDHLSARRGHIVRRNRHAVTWSSAVADWIVAVGCLAPRVVEILAIVINRHAGQVRTRDRETILAHATYYRAGDDLQHARVFDQRRRGHQRRSHRRRTVLGIAGRIGSRISFARRRGNDTPLATVALRTLAANQRDGQDGNVNHGLARAGNDKTARTRGGRAAIACRSAGCYCHRIVATRTMRRLDAGATFGRKLPRSPPKC